jgi:zinc/manganese transport system substrate-binding protein
MSRRSKYWVPGYALCALALLALAASACGGAGAGGGSDGKVRIVAAENFWGNIAAQLGGNQARVVSIISNPNSDPHLYAANAATAAAVAQAQVVIENGVGYDTFMGDLLGASGAHPLVVSAQQALGVSGADANPHLWYDVSRVPTVAAAIERALARVDPVDTSAFQENLAKFDASLAPLEAVIAKIRSSYGGAPVAYTERVAGYLVADAGLRVVSPPGFARAIEDGNEPAPADVQAMNALFAGGTVRLLLYNEQTVSAATQGVRAEARRYGVPVVAVSETLPPSDRDYQAWQLRQAKEIFRALGG